MRLGIVDTVKRALGDQKVKSVVICGQNGVFCGGINIFMLSLQCKTKEMQLKKQTFRRRMKPEMITSYAFTVFGLGPR